MRLVDCWAGWAAMGDNVVPVGQFCKLRSAAVHASDLKFFGGSQRAVSPTAKRTSETRQSSVDLLPL